MFKLIRGVISGLIGGVAWNFGMKISFWPAQKILADPNLQSQKFLSVFYNIEPLPRMFDNSWIFTIGLLLVGIFYGLVFSFLSDNFSGNWFKKGVVFGLVGWALMVPWFEFYLPWNVMHEPISLVFLEAGLWAVVLQIVGLSVSFSNNIMSKISVKLNNAKG